jgi:hypothetical protein
MMASCVAGLGVWKYASMSHLAAASAITPPACAVRLRVARLAIPLAVVPMGHVGPPSFRRSEQS